MNLMYSGKFLFEPAYAAKKIIWSRRIGQTPMLPSLKIHPPVHFPVTFPFSSFPT